MKNGFFPVLVFVMCFAAMAAAQSVAAGDGKLRERLRERMQHKTQQGAGDADNMIGAGEDFLTTRGGSTCEEHFKKINRRITAQQGRGRKLVPDAQDIAYGTHERQRFDVYMPKENTSAAPAPVILMVHGGGWCVGDKALSSVVENKVSRWTARGFVFVSVNYPMIAQGYDALAQAHEIAAATAYVQKHAAEWGGDGARVILMGHSAGAHLVSLVGASQNIRRAAGVEKILGVVSIDAGAVDIAMQMPKVIAPLKTRYAEAFGTDPVKWAPMSPLGQLDAAAAPWLGICSSTRPDEPCAQAAAYVEKSKNLGIPAQVLSLPMGHGKLNAALGQDSAYTKRVEAFMSALDPSVALLLR